MNRVSPAIAIGVVGAFAGGFSTHYLYQRWNPPAVELGEPVDSRSASEKGLFQPQSHRVTFIPRATRAAIPVDLPLLQARDTGAIRGLSGNRARIRGRVFRVGHAAKSDTYFLNFGPSREALTAVIFASAVEVFEKKKLAPKQYEGKDVEIEGTIKDHPQFGLEIILEDPAQIRIVN